MAIHENIWKSEKKIPKFAHPLTLDMDFSYWYLKVHSFLNERRNLYDEAFWRHLQQLDMRTNGTDVPLRTDIIGLFGKPCVVIHIVRKERSFSGVADILWHYDRRDSTKRATSLPLRDERVYRCSYLKKKENCVVVRVGKNWLWSDPRVDLTSQQTRASNEDRRDRWLLWIELYLEISMLLRALCLFTVYTWIQCP